MSTIHVHEDRPFVLFSTDLDFQSLYQKSKDKTFHSAEDPDGDSYNFMF